MSVERRAYGVQLAGLRFERGEASGWSSLRGVRDGRTHRTRGHRGSGDVDVEGIEQRRTLVGSPHRNRAQSLHQTQYGSHRRIRTGRAHRTSTGAPRWQRRLRTRCRRRQARRPTRGRAPRSRAAAGWSGEPPTLLACQRIEAEQDMRRGRVVESARRHDEAVGGGRLPRVLPLAASRKERGDHALSNELPIEFQRPALTKHEQPVELG
jgi:hypothetical protein